MSPDNAEKEILRIYETEYLWLLGGLQIRDPVWGALPFYFWLHENYPELLDFPDDGDRYQTIASWVSEANRQWNIGFDETPKRTTGEIIAHRKKCNEEVERLLPQLKSNT